MDSIFIQITNQQITYHQDLAPVFHRLCQNKGATLLLESAEIRSKNSLQSLLIAQSALKISCVGQTVFIQALTNNGLAILPLLSKRLDGKAKLSSIAGGEFSATFSSLDQNLDEDSKLQANTIFEPLRLINHLYQHAETPVFQGGLFGYDLVANFIPMDDISLQQDEIDCPDYVFYLAEQLIRFDHQNQQAQLQTFCFNPDSQPLLQQNAQQIIQQMENLAPLPEPQKVGGKIEINYNDEEFKQIISNLKSHIYQGDVFQIVPSRRFSLACPNPLASYHQLKKNNPSPYMFYLQDDDFILFGASPESALKFDPNNRQIEIYPIAGSRPRGFQTNGEIDPELDARLELELRLDQKELAEHLMLVDLARNDIARVCETGSRKVQELMQVDRYSHVMHLVSRIVGKLRPELDSLQAYQACMNMGTLTGAPKIKAMQLIYQVEKQKRHSYGGAVGYLSSDGFFDTCIVIRSAFVQKGMAYVQAGCGTVLDSDPQREADETRHKASAVLKTILQVNQGEK